MARVVSISGHPYGSWRAKGDIYEVDDKDLALMKSLKRVRDVTPEDEKRYQQQYKTRDMEAQRGPILGARGNITTAQRQTELHSGSVNEAPDLGLDVGGASTARPVARTPARPAPLAGKK